MASINDVDFQFGWLPTMYRELLKLGHSQLSRLGPTHELLNATLEFPADAYPYRPGIARKLGFVELLQIISGYFDERHISQAAPGLRYPYGPNHAYGTKIVQQLPKLVQQLKRCPDSRRAILHIGQPADGQETEKPCIQSYQFHIRHDRLFTTVYARSWDVISGLPYDVCVASGLTQMMAHLLNGLFPVYTTFFVGSLHLYDGVWEELQERWADKFSVPSGPFPAVFEMPKFSLLDSYREWAIDQLNDMDNWKRGLPAGVTDGV